MSVSAPCVLGRGTLRSWMILLLVFSEDGPPSAFNVVDLLPLLFLLRRGAVGGAGVGDILGCEMKGAATPRPGPRGGRGGAGKEPDGRRTDDRFMIGSLTLKNHKVPLLTESCGRLTQPGNSFYHFSETASVFRNLPVDLRSFLRRKQPTGYLLGSLVIHRPTQPLSESIDASFAFPACCRP